VDRRIPRGSGTYYWRFLEWDKERVGWDQGIWLGPYQSTDALTYLSDDVYRVVLKARIGINNWNGQNGTLPDILKRPLRAPE
jgi:hypothetical protein